MLTVRNTKCPKCNSTLHYSQAMFWTNQAEHMVFVGTAHECRACALVWFEPLCITEQGFLGIKGKLGFDITDPNLGKEIEAHLEEMRSARRIVDAAFGEENDGQ